MRAAMEQGAAATRTGRRVSVLEMMGLGIALLALGGAVVSPWVMEALKPESRPADEVAAEVAKGIKDRLVAKVKRQKYVAPAKPERLDRSRWYAGSVAAAGALGVGAGVLGLVSRRRSRVSWATVALGASAILFPYAVAIAATALAIVVLVLIFSMWS